MACLNKCFNPSNIPVTVFLILPPRLAFSQQQLDRRSPKTIALG
jgi:hypothetical protein